MGKVERVEGWGSPELPLSGACECLRPRAAQPLPRVSGQLPWLEELVMVASVQTGCVLPLWDQGAARGAAGLAALHEGYCPAAGTETPWAGEGGSCDAAAGGVLVVGCVLG